MDRDTTIRIAQLLGVLSSCYSAGINTGISYVAVPTILMGPPRLMAQQWKSVYNRGLATAPFIGMGIGTPAFAYLAYAIPKLRMAYATAALLPMMLGPWTLLVMLSTNKKLFAREEIASKQKAGEDATEVGMPKGESTPELVRLWGNYNWVRMAFTLAGSAVGLWATLS